MRYADQMRRKMPMAGVRDHAACLGMPLSRQAALVVLSALDWLPALVHILARTVKPLRLGVIGAGSLGGTTGRLWVQACHEMLFLARHSEVQVARALTGMPRQAAGFGLVARSTVPLAVDRYFQRSSSVYRANTKAQEMRCLLGLGERR
jgi:hypothetical protein